MSGYDHSMGMSNNAVSAYDDGRTTISNLTASMLKRAKINFTVRLAKWLAKNNKWTTTEYHHTGKFFNSSDFYDLDDLEILLNEADPKELAEWIEASKKKQAKALVVVRVSGEYTWFTDKGRFGGVEEFAGELRGNWIHLDEGGKKNKNGNWIKYKTI